MCEQLPGQMDIFDFLPKFQITKPVRLIELFAGIGSQAMALRVLGVNFEHWRAIEFDRFAMASYNAIHGTNFEPQDINNTRASDLGIYDKDKYCYIMTYSFPCQDLSVAGKMAGMKKGSGTRSGLLWEVERLLKECFETGGSSCLPDVLLMENVPAVIGKKNKPDFDKWEHFLTTLGYRNFLPPGGKMNAKDYGVAQNRERCFMVSILNDGSEYEFPEPIPLAKCMRDYLDTEVPERFYINSDKARTLIENLLDRGVLPEDCDKRESGGA